MQQSSPNLIKAGTFRYTAVCENVIPTPDLTLFDTLHFLRAGAQLVLSYNFAARAFTGTLENTTEATLRRVGVEVHFSNGTKLDLTNPVDLDPGQIVAITLPAPLQTFLLWTACPRVG